MNTGIWILQGVLAASFLAAGALKLLTPRLELAKKMTWASDFSDGGVKLIGLAEVLGAIGLVLPWLLHIAPVLTPVAAAGLCLLMLGAVATHFKLKDGQWPPALVLAVLTAVVAYARF